MEGNVSVITSDHPCDDGNLQRYPKHLSMINNVEDIIVFSKG